MKKVTQLLAASLYSSSNIIKNFKSRLLRRKGHVILMEQSRNAYIVLVGRPERKRERERQTDTQREREREKERDL